ncbi:MAG: HAD family hydrolase [Candidatus Hadarchaeota archaeon]|nr:HAD family hydrolase [Candidatus Hadarchaeota archaeon]
MKIRTISFDVDGTLISRDFMDAVWFEGVPKLYAEKLEISFEEALERVKDKYNKVGAEKVEWADIKFWFRFLSLGEGWKDLLEKYGSRVSVSPEVRGVLEELRKRYKLIISSSTTREFLDVILRETKLGNFFERIFLSTSDYGKTGKDADFYREVCRGTKLTPEQLVHVGDNWNFDFLVPRKVGINALYLDRAGEKRGKFIIRDLNELKNFLQARDT